MQGQKPEADDDELAGDEEHEPFESGVHEAVGMEADAKHVHAKPGETRDDVAEDGKIHNAALANDSAPARVKNDGVPEDDEKRAVFFRVPTPKAAPGLIGPDAAQDGAGKAEERGETNDAIDHFGKGFPDFDLATAFCD